LGRPKHQGGTLTRAAPPPNQTALVSDSPQRVQLSLEIDLAADPITGVLRHEHGADRPFAGWMALVRALELALDIERGETDPPVAPASG